MTNNNAVKGRSAERCAQSYLEYLGWTVLDLHHNDSIEGLSNADLLAFAPGHEPEGTPQQMLDDPWSFETQVKYSSVNSYGFQGIYNRHEREGVDLGAYRSSPADADLGESRAILWGRYDGWLMSGGVRCFHDAVGRHQGYNAYEVPNVMGKQMKGFVNAADVVMCRAPYEPWLCVWR